MDLNEVAMFVQVVRAGSFVEAARPLGMPGNTLSLRISKLEARLDTRSINALKADRADRVRWRL